MCHMLPISLTGANKINRKIWLILLCSILLQQGLYAQKQFSTASLNTPNKFGDEFRSLFKVIEIPEFKCDTVKQSICIENGLRSSTYINIEDWLEVKDEVKVTGVSVVFSKYPIVNGVYPKFHQLLCDRLKNLFAFAPELNVKNLSWEMILQTNCINDAQVNTLFHGVVIKYEPLTTSPKTLPNNVYNKPFDINKPDEVIINEGSKSALFPADFHERMSKKPQRVRIDSMIAYLESNLVSDEDFNRSNKDNKSVEADKKQVLNILKKFGFNQNEKSINEIFNRNKTWKNVLVVADWTGSMYPYGAQALIWHINHQNESPINYYTLFNDGDNKQLKDKLIGKTGGIYHAKADNLIRIAQLYQLVAMKGGGGDGPENDIEALLAAMQHFPEHESLVLIADNHACIRDMSLVDSIKKPVHIIACGYNKDYGVNPQFIQLALKTGGSIHTADVDITDIKNATINNNSITSGKAQLTISVLPCFDLSSVVIFDMGLKGLDATVYNSIEGIEEAGVSGHQLDLSNRLLTKLPRQLFKVESMRVLNLSHNLLAAVTDKISALYNLNILNISNNHLREVSEEIGKLKRLNKLELSENRLDTLPESLFTLPILTTLNLSYNNIKYLSDRPTCRKLEYLFLEHNKLLSLPTFMQALRKLRVLQVSNNKLTYLPKSIGSLTRLEVLDLSYNQLTQLPPAIAKLTNLKALKLTGNPISNEELIRIKLWLPNTVIEF